MRISLSAAARLGIVVPKPARPRDEPGPTAVRVIERPDASGEMEQSERAERVPALNGLEREFHEKWVMPLEASRAASCLAQRTLFRLAGGGLYRPDFAVIWGERMALVEVKGHAREDDFLKLKDCARTFPFWDWYLARKRAKTWLFHQVTSQGVGRKPARPSWLDL